LTSTPGSTTENQRTKRTSTATAVHAGLHHASSAASRIWGGGLQWRTVWRQRPLQALAADSHDSDMLMSDNVDLEVPVLSRVTRYERRSINKKKSTLIGYVPSSSWAYKRCGAQKLPAPPPSPTPPSSVSSSSPPDLMAQENVPACCNPSTSNLTDFFDIIFLMFYAEACFRTV
jgi:hypothetical protein